MKLEIIKNKPEKTSPYPPLLLVHGIYHGAWCWQKNYIPYFTHNGFEVWAMSLRGHGKSEGRERLQHFRIWDYLEDVKRVAAMMDRPPVLLGHSLGGVLVQKYIERNYVPAAVTIGSPIKTTYLPSRIAVDIFMSLFFRYPRPFLKSLFTLNPYSMVRDYWHRLLIASDLPQEEGAAIKNALQKESIPVIIDLAFFYKVYPQTVQTPVLVIGGAKDELVPERHLRESAELYGATLYIDPEAGHDMMLEQNWEPAAEVILGWLKKRVGP